MIEPTGEMKAAFRVAQEQRAAELVAEGAPLGGHDILDRGLAAVLALVERDYDIRPRHTAGAVAAAPDNYVIERHPDGRVTTHYVGPTTADVLAAAGRQDTRPTGAQLRDAQDGVVIHIPGDGPLSQPAPDAGHHLLSQCPDCTSPFRAHRYVLPLMRDGVYVGNHPCPDPWHDRPLTITKVSSVTYDGRDLTPCLTQPPATAPCLDADADADHLAALSDDPIRPDTRTDPT